MFIGLYRVWGLGLYRLITGEGASSAAHVRGCRINFAYVRTLNRAYTSWFQILGTLGNAVGLGGEALQGLQSSSDFCGAIIYIYTPYKPYTPQTL